MLKAQGTPLAGALTSVMSRHLVHIYLSCWRSIFGWSISGRTASCPTQTSASSAGSRSAAESDLLRPTVLTRKPLTAKYPRCISVNSQYRQGAVSHRGGRSGAGRRSSPGCRPPSARRLSPGWRGTPRGDQAVLRLETFRCVRCSDNSCTFKIHIVVCIAGHRLAMAKGLQTVHIYKS